VRNPDRSECPAGAFVRLRLPAALVKRIDEWAKLRR
jgi:hypothetical protein